MYCHWYSITYPAICVVSCHALANHWPTTWLAHDKTFISLSPSLLFVVLIVDCQAKWCKYCSTVYLHLIDLSILHCVFPLLIPFLFIFPFRPAPAIRLVAHYRWLTPSLLPYSPLAPRRGVVHLCLPESATFAVLLLVCLIYARPKSARRST